MTIDRIIVLIAGLVGIGFTYWFFLFKQKKFARPVKGEIEILVAGGYKPEAIEIPANVPTKITFLRKDPSSCLEEVVLSDFSQKKFLPLNEKVTIEINPQKKGEFSFMCGMSMYHGTIKVV